MRNASQIAAQVPSIAHRRLRWYTVFHGPDRSGRSRQVIPSPDGARVAVCVCPTDEERQIAELLRLW